MENNITTVNESGTPQGGAISPTIFNFVLNGIEEEIMQIKDKNSTVYPIRYADDILVMATDPKNLELAKTKIIEFLKPRGLHLNEEKTTITKVSDKNGINFLGYNIREYP